jgi:HK97 family phage major capsid protein
MTLHRYHSIQRAGRVAADGDLTVNMAFASDAPYERWWGIEVLDVKGARLDRLNDGAPLLYNHNWDELRGVHVPGSVRADGAVLRGQVRITSATQAGRDTIALVESGVLTKASVGYEILKVVEMSTNKAGEPVEREIDGPTFERLLMQHGVTRDAHGFRRGLDAAAGPIERESDKPVVYKVTDWLPMENSLVTVPADASVGVGRGAEPAPQVPQPAAKAAATEERSNVDATNNAAGGANPDTSAQRAGSLPAQPNGTSGNRAMELENDRRLGIENLCKAMGMDDDMREHWLGSGLSVAKISGDLLKIQEQRSQRNPQSAAKLGLGEGETNRYSLMNAIRATADKNWSNAGFELECSRAVAQKLNTVSDPNKFYVPYEVQQRQLPRRGTPGRRDLTAGTTTAGGFLVPTQNVSFIEQLRNSTIAYQMGARRLTVDGPNVTVPRQTAAATAVWLATEASTITESQQTFGQMSLSPKTVGAYTEISRQLMLQSSPDAESIVTADLAAVAGLAIDVGVLRGSGASGEPLGIVNTAGIGSVSGTNFLTAANTFDRVLEFQSDVATANIRPNSGGYVTTPGVAKSLMQIVKFSSTASPLWEGNLYDGTMAGYPCMSSNQMTAASMIYGDWDQVVIAEWGVLQVEVNPYANFQAGIIGVRAIVSVDVGLRYAAAFSLASSIAV